MSLNTTGGGQKRDLKGFFWSNLEYVPFALTIVVGAFATLFFLFGNFSQTYILLWILTIVALLATSEFIGRIKSIRQIEQTTQDTVAKVDKLTKDTQQQFTAFAKDTQQQFTALRERVSVNNALITRKQIMEFDQRIISAKEILLCGLTLSSITGTKYYKSIDSRIGQGTVVKIILLNPDSDNLDTFAKKFERDITSKELRDQIKESLSVLIDLYEKHPQAKFEVKLFDADMPYSIIATDPEEPNGRIHIEIYAHKCPALERPHIELQKVIDEPPWFNRFYEEFGRRWTSSSQIIPFTSHRFPFSEPEAVQGRAVVFLDRDGVINEAVEEGKYVSSVQEFHFKPTSIEAIGKLLEKNFYVIVVTNQAGIGRGMVSLEIIDEIHAYLLKETSVRNKHIQAVYVCPHAREANCSCRKPRAGLLRRACAELKIKPEHAFLIGDSESDIVAGINIGCKTIQIQEKNSSCTKVDADYTVANLSEAVTKILQLGKK